MTCQDMTWTWHGHVVFHQQQVTLGSTLITFRSRLFLNNRPCSLSAFTWKLGVGFEVELPSSYHIITHHIITLDTPTNDDRAPVPVPLPAPVRFLRTTNE